MGLRLLAGQTVMCTILSKVGRTRLQVVDPIFRGGYSSDARSFAAGAFLFDDYRRCYAQGVKVG